MLTPAMVPPVAIIRTFGFCPKTTTDVDNNTINAMLLKKFIMLLFLTQFHLSWLLTKLKFSHPKKSSFKSTIKVNYFYE
ncbi:hypothetical protein CCAN2_1400001 [Capnocytophaga canimorsus]|nr:hypothetical protein CCAN2_1400001 [Capnocytophaga canimorsus]